MIRVVRGLLGVLGVGVGVYGASLLRDLGPDNLVETGKWLVGGVVLHDAVIGPATILLAAVGVLVLRRPLPGPVVIGALVLGSVTLSALPALGRFGARPDNPTLLDRDYLLGWSVLAGLTLLVVVVCLLVGRRRAKGR